MQLIASGSAKFLSTPSARRATRNAITSAVAMVFLSTPSARRATAPWCRPQTSPSDFYPRPPRGGRLFPSFCTSRHYKFLSTPSARRATFVFTPMLNPPELFLSTPSARRATIEAGRAAGHFKISIHALREEGDLGVCPHVDGVGKFLSTPSARRATPWRLPGSCGVPFLSTPSARRATAKTEKNISTFVSL